MHENSKIGGLRLPPFGGELAERLRYGNSPLWVIICTGRNAWERAKDPQTRVGDCVPLVWPNAALGRYRWPVRGCAVIVEADAGPSLEQLRALAGELLTAGAECVLLWSIAWRLACPTIFYPDGSGEVLDADDLNEVLRPEGLRRVA